MKILDVIWSIDPREGGMSAGVRSSAEACARLGHRRDVVCLDPPDVPWIKDAGMKVFAVGVGSQFPERLLKSMPGAKYGYTPRLRAWLKAHAKNYDAVIVNGIWNYGSFGTWRALRGSGTPYFLYTHGMLDPWFNRAYPLKTVLKTIFWKLIEHRVPRDARGVLFTSEEERRLARRSFAPYSAAEFVVGYGARDPDFDPRTGRETFLEKVPAARSRNYILFLSRIHEKKGVDLLINAFGAIHAEFPDIDLVVAGPDEVGLVAPLRKLVAELGISDRVHWPGMLNGDAKWGAFGSADFFVLPSHQENFGVVVAESLAMAKPVLITNKVNIWREIQGDGAGMVVDDNQEGITRGLRAMLSLSAARRLEMSARARDCFLQRYDMVENTKSLLTLLATLVPSEASK